MSRWLPFAITLLVAACAGLNAPDKPEHITLSGTSQAARALRESQVNGEWQNRRYSELVAAWGAPSMVMTIPGGGNPPGFVVVYGQDQRTGCIDAFAMLYGDDPRVRIYHCR